MRFGNFLVARGAPAIAIIGLAAFAHGSTVSFVGGQTDTAATFRTAGASNVYAANGAQYYAQDGFELFNTRSPSNPGGGANGPGAGTNIFAVPSYVTPADSTAAPVTLAQDSGAAGYPGYASVNDPRTTPGATPSQVISGTLGSGGGTLFTFTLTGVVPAQIRIGLLVDNLNGGGGYDSATLTVSSSGGGTISTPEIKGTVDTPDLYFFDINNAVAGDTISVGGTSGTNGTNEIGGITFDTVPEPASLGIFAFAGVAMLARRRSK